VNIKSTSKQEFIRDFANKIAGQPFLKNRSTGRKKKEK